jgi:hypothetical protein
MYIKPLDPYFDDKMRFIMEVPVSHVASLGPAHSQLTRSHRPPQSSEAHFKEEEEVLFPKLRHAVSHDLLLTMTLKIEKARINAPTRPHVLSSSSPASFVRLTPPFIISQ